MLKFLLALTTTAIAMTWPAAEVSLTWRRATTLDSLGACQGISVVGNKLYLYGDREVGMMREYVWQRDSLRYTGHEYRLTVNGQDVINHPTGLAHHSGLPTFIGNSIRLNPEGTQWKAVIYAVNWDGLRRTGTLDQNLEQTIDDDACIQGTRPEYVQYNGKWYVATADYGQRANEVRLYEPTALAKARKTSEPGVLVTKFTCGPWVQNLHWIPGRNVLVLIQNQIEGRRWRFTFLDFPRSVETGQAVVLNTIDLDCTDELEGFTLLPNSGRGIAVSSARQANVGYVDLRW